MAAHCLERARSLIAASGEEVGEVVRERTLVLDRGLIAVIGEEAGELTALDRGLIPVRGEEVRELFELLRQIEASGDLTAAGGDEVSDVELSLQKR